MIVAPTLVGAQISETRDIGRSDPVNVEYPRILDAYFEHLRGVSATAVILRVSGGLSLEYEIVLDPEVSPKSITRWAATNGIWGNVFDLARPKRSTQEYISDSYTIPASHKESSVPEERVRNLWRRSLVIDVSTSERGPFKDSKGHTVVMLDAPYYEMITNGGKTRVRVTDTSNTKIMSSNPELLHWARELDALFTSTSASTN
jgi:hypothetical protein